MSTTLERLSWVASIVSVILGLLVWLFPTPLSLVNSVNNNSATVFPEARLVAFLLFIYLGAHGILYKWFNKDGKLKIEIDFVGDWTGHAIFSMGFFLSLFFGFVLFPIELKFLIPKIVTMLLGVALMVWGLRHMSGNVVVNGKITY